MTIQKRSRAPRYAVLAVLLALTGSGGVLAQHPDRGGLGGPERFDGHGALGGHGDLGREHISSSFGEHRDPAHEHFDGHFSHNRSYFNPGYTVREAPRRGYAIDQDHHRYWYDRGEWYRWGGVDWTVVGAPLGAFVAVLPPFYTTVMVGGVPYYYANDTYYDWNSGQEEYEVVAPPAGVDASGTAQPAPDGQLYVYPRNGVSSEQQASDRYECDISAVDKTGFDPTKEDGGVSPEAAPAKRADYFRAEAACLEARGYSVR